MKVNDSLLRLYHHRALAEALIARDLKARYRGTVLGFLWCLLNPFMLMLTYFVVFSLVFHLEMPHFPVFLLAGLLPWTAIASALTESSYTLIGNGSLIRKVALPAEVFPLVCVGMHSLHFLLSIPVLLAFMMAAGMSVPWSITFLPVILGVQMLFTLGLALLVAALGVQFRDLHLMAPNLLMIWFFLTPIIYPVTMVQDGWQSYLALNPAAALIKAYQDVLYYGTSPSVMELATLFVISCLLIMLGLRVFDARREFIAEEV